MTEQKLLEVKRKFNRTKLNNVLHDNGLSFNDLQYIREKDFKKLRGVGNILLSFTKKELERLNMTFGTWRIDDFMKNRDDIVKVVNKRADIPENLLENAGALEAFRIQTARDILVAMVSNKFDELLMDQIVEPDKAGGAIVKIAIDMADSLIAGLFKAKDDLKIAVAQ